MRATTPPSRQAALALAVLVLVVLSSSSAFDAKAHTFGADQAPALKSSCVATSGSSDVTAVPGPGVFNVSPILHPHHKIPFPASSSEGPQSSGSLPHATAARINNGTGTLTCNNAHMPTTNDAYAPTSNDAETCTSNDAETPNSNDSETPTSNDSKTTTSNDDKARPSVCASAASLNYATSSQGIGPFASQAHASVLAPTTSPKDTSTTQAPSDQFLLNWIASLVILANLCAFLDFCLDTRVALIANSRASTKNAIIGTLICIVFTSFTQPCSAQPTQCTATQVANSDKAASGSITGPILGGTSVMVTCNAGYQGGGNVTCQASGTFTTVVCQVCTVAAGRYCLPAGSTSGNLCEAGYKCLGGMSPRQKCDAAGEYQNEVGKDTCKKCSNGEQPNTNRDACVQCNTGEITDPSSGVCVRCLNGKQPNEAKNGCEQCTGNQWAAAGDASCKTCNPGSQPNSTQNGCKQCDDGKYSSNQTNFLCASCPSGQGPTTKKDGCGTCSIGYYSNAGTNPQYQCTVCTGAMGNYCPAGSQDAKGIPCPIGHSCAGNSADKAQCAAGSYQDKTGKDACTKCPTGKYQESQGSTSCKTCAAGSGATAEGATDCSGCSPGQILESGKCTDCPNGRIPNNDKSACIKCAAGTFVAQNGTKGTCGNCTTDTIAPLEGSGACTACPAGQTSFSPFTQCVKCAAGKYRSQGNAGCSGCPLGLYSEEGWGACRPCPQGTKTTDGVSCSKCSAGSQPNADGKTCSLCSDGQYSNAGTDFVCRPCPVGTTSVSGSGSCTRCAVNKYTTDGKVCNACGSGKQPNANQNGCEECDVGYRSSIDTNNSCVRCGAGSESSANHETCTTCDPGEWSEAGGVCQPCPDGFQRSKIPSEGDQCVVCGQGSYSNGAQGCVLCDPGETSVNGSDTSCACYKLFPDTRTQKDVLLFANPKCALAQTGARRQDGQAGKTWDQARATCKSQGGDLVSVWNPQERALLMSRLQGSLAASAWVGLDTAPGYGNGGERFWSWADGALAPSSTTITGTDVPWLGGLPTAASGQCGAIDQGGNFLPKPCNGTGAYFCSVCNNGRALSSNCVDCPGNQYLDTGSCKSCPTLRPYSKQGSTSENDCKSSADLQLSKPVGMQILQTEWVSPCLQGGCWHVRGIIGNGRNDADTVPTLFIPKFVGGQNLLKTPTSTVPTTQDHPCLPENLESKSANLCCVEAFTKAYYVLNGFGADAPDCPTTPPKSDSVAPPMNSSVARYLSNEGVGGAEWSIVPLTGSNQVPASGVPELQEAVSTQSYVKFEKVNSDPEDVRYYFDMYLDGPALEASASLMSESSRYTRSTAIGFAHFQPLFDTVTGQAIPTVGFTVQQSLFTFTKKDLFTLSSVAETGLNFIVDAVITPFKVANQSQSDGGSARRQNAGSDKCFLSVLVAVKKGLKICPNRAALPFDKVKVRSTKSGTSAIEIDSCGSPGANDQIDNRQCAPSMQHCVQPSQDDLDVKSSFSVSFNMRHGNESFCFSGADEKVDLEMEINLCYEDDSVATSVLRSSYSILSEDSSGGVVQYCKEDFKAEADLSAFVLGAGVAKGLPRLLPGGTFEDPEYLSFTAESLKQGQNVQFSGNAAISPDALMTLVVVGNPAYFDSKGAVAARSTLAIRDIYTVHLLENFDVDAKENLQALLSEGMNALFDIKSDSSVDRLSPNDRLLEFCPNAEGAGSRQDRIAANQPWGCHTRHDWNDGQGFNTDPSDGDKDVGMFKAVMLSFDSISEGPQNTFMERLFENFVTKTASGVTADEREARKTEWVSSLKTKYLNRVSADEDRYRRAIWINPKSDWGQENSMPALSAQVYMFALVTVSRPGGARRRYLLSQSPNSNGMSAVAMTNDVDSIKTMMVAMGATEDQFSTLDILFRLTTEEACMERTALTKSLESKSVLSLKDCSKGVKKAQMIQAETKLNGVKCATSLRQMQDGEYSAATLRMKLSIIWDTKSVTDAYLDLDLLKSLASVIDVVVDKMPENVALKASSQSSLDVEASSGSGQTTVQAAVGAVVAVVAILTGAAFLYFHKQRKQARATMFPTAGKMVADVLPPTEKEPVKGSLGFLPATDSFIGTHVPFISRPVSSMPVHGENNVVCDEGFCNGPFIDVTVRPRVSVSE